MSFIGILLFESEIKRLNKSIAVVLQKALQTNDTLESFAFVFYSTLFTGMCNTVFLAQLQETFYPR